MFKSKFLGLLLITVLMISSTAFSYAGESEPITITENDTFSTIDDQVIKDMIEGIQDPVKKEKIREYWITPAWWSNAAPDIEANDMKIKEAVIKIQQLIDTPTVRLDSAIKALLEKDITQIAKTKNINIFPEYVQYLQRKAVVNASLLNDKVADCVNILSNEETVVSLRNTIITKNTYGTYTQGNSSSVYYLYLRADLTWSYDQYTTYITDLDYTHTTDHGAYYSISGLVKNKESKMNSGTPGYGLIHKSNYVGALTVGAYFVVDIKVQESQALKKYVNLLTEQLYPGFNWSN